VYTINNDNKNTILSAPEGVDVLSLFDGMSCGMIAIRNAELKVNNSTYGATGVAENVVITNTAKRG